MKKQKWKRLAAGFLAAVMLAGTMPVSSLAALWDNPADRNEEILSDLTAFWGDERTAAEALDLLKEYGLVDENGHVLTDWSGEIFLTSGGQTRATDVTELLMLLETGEYDPAMVITVDGTDITGDIYHYADL